MSGPHSSGLYHFYRLQPTIAINIVAPDPLYIANVWINVLPQTANCMLFWVKFLINPLANNEVRFIIDGTTHTMVIVAGIANQWYSVFRDPTGQGDGMGSSNDAAALVPAMYFTGMEGRTVQVDCRQTAAVGAGDNIRCAVTYGVL